MTKNKLARDKPTRHSQKKIEKSSMQASPHSKSHLVSEIAYELGFEHSQSFSKLFKTKTNFSPLKFRASFN